MELRTVASGLRFPEGPVACTDGTVIVVEIAAGAVTRVHPDGRLEQVAEPGGGPNGAALGPDGHLYVANNGGAVTFLQCDGRWAGGPHDPARYSGGRIERIDLDSGRVDVVFTECDGRPLRHPNDLVFDATGGFWCTDTGVRQQRARDRTGVYYGRPDGTSLREVIFPLDAPNGVGLSPDGSELYVAETFTGRLWAYPLLRPGEIDPAGARLLRGLGGDRMVQGLDSLAVDAAGNVCVATIFNGGIAVVAPDGTLVGWNATGDPLTTNLCFGGPAGTTAWVTLSGSGRLAMTDWPPPPDLQP